MENETTHRAANAQGLAQCARPRCVDLLTLTMTMNWKCYFFHDWHCFTKAFMVTYPEHMAHRNGMQDQRIRECLRCGKRERRHYSYTQEEDGWYPFPYANDETIKMKMAT